MTEISDGDRRRLAGLLTRLQDGAERVGEEEEEIPPNPPFAKGGKEESFAKGGFVTGGKDGDARVAHTVGISGAAGVGKSTLVSRMLPVLRGEGLRVVVLAIDPTSDKTQGALLGDRIRMRDSYLDSGVFIRSLATRGAPEALTVALPAMVRASAMFCDVVLVETAGAGQADIGVHALVDTFVVVFAPLGDVVTLMKSGQIEHAHVAAVNKRKGLAGADSFSEQARMTLGRDRVDGWRRRVFSLDAAQAEGVEEFVRNGVLAHRDSRIGSVS